MFSRFIFADKQFCLRTSWLISPKVFSSLYIPTTTHIMIIPCSICFSSLKRNHLIRSSSNNPIISCFWLYNLCYQ